jgi:hypothetical protein
VWHACWGSVRRLLSPECATLAHTRLSPHSFFTSLSSCACARMPFSETHDAGSREMGLSSRPARCSPQEADGKEWEGGGEER